MTQSLLSLDSWLQIGSAVALVQLLMNSLKNFRTARRLVPIGNMCPSMIEECNAIPLCFVGSEKRLTRALLWLYARVWIRRSSTKQAFLCDAIEFLTEESNTLSPSVGLKPGDRVEATFALGESRSHARRSAVRSAVGSELVLAIVRRSDNRARYERQVRCVTVRAQGVPRSNGSTTLPSRTLQWQVINPTGVGSRADMRRSWESTPASAVWLVLHETLQARRDRELIQSGQGLPRVRPFYSSGSSPSSGFGLAFLRTVGRVSSIGLFFAVLILSEWDWSTLTAWRFGLLGILFYVNALMFRHIFSFAFRVKAPVHFPTGSSQDTKLPWHGATTRSLALGDSRRRAGLAARLSFLYWEPTKSWIRNRCSRFGIGDLLSREQLGISRSREHGSEPCPTLETWDH